MSFIHQVTTPDENVTVIMTKIEEFYFLVIDKNA